jgi:hypothetical protein
MVVVVDVLHHPLKGVEVLDNLKNSVETAAYGLTTGSCSLFTSLQTLQIRVGFGPGTGTEKFGIQTLTCIATIHTGTCLHKHLPSSDIHIPAAVHTISCSHLLSTQEAVHTAATHIQYPQRPLFIQTAAHLHYPHRQLFS